MSIIKTARDSLKSTLSDGDFEGAHDAATNRVNIALVRHAHRAGISLRKVGAASWLITDLEPCLDNEEVFFRTIRMVEFGVPVDGEITLIAHGSANEIEAEAKTFRRALLRFACFEGWRFERLNAVIALLLGEDRCLDTAEADAMIREELADVLGDGWRMRPLPQVRYVIARQVVSGLDFLRVTNNEFRICENRAEATRFSGEEADFLTRIFSKGMPVGAPGKWMILPQEVRFPSPYQPQEKGADERRKRDTAAVAGEDTMVAAVRQAIMDVRGREREVSKAIAARFGLGIPRAAQTEGGVA